MWNPRQTSNKHDIIWKNYKKIIWVHWHNWVLLHTRKSVPWKPQCSPLLPRLLLWCNIIVMHYCWIQHSCISENIELLTGASTARRLIPGDWHSWYRNAFYIRLKKKIIINIIQLQTLGQQWNTSTMDWCNIGVSTMAVTSHFLIGFTALPEHGQHYGHGSCGQETELTGFRLQ